MLARELVGKEPTVDERAMGLALGGALLVATSALRAQSAAERAMHASMRRELQRIGHGWRHRVDNLGSAAGGLLGVAVLLYAIRASVRAPEVPIATT
jgi:hypothetical protein